MPKKPFISIDVGRVKADLVKAGKVLEGLDESIERALRQAMVEYMNDVQADAQQKAPIGDTGDLRASATTTDPIEEGNGVVVFTAFNLVYAALRDQGTKGLPGGVIRPVRAKRLFIPLRKGVRPGDPNLIRGVDFVLAKEVRQQGNGYLTATFNERKVNAAQLIGQRIFELVRAGA
jgi:hypothetical protein